MILQHAVVPFGALDYGRAWSARTGQIRDTTAISLLQTNSRLSAECRRIVHKNLSLEIILGHKRLTTMLAPGVSRRDARYATLRGDRDALLQDVQNYDTVVLRLLFGYDTAAVIAVE